MNKLDGQVALVVGAGHGPGRELARQLAARGARVALNDQMPDAIEKLAEELGGAARAFPAETAKKVAAQALVQDVLEAYERIDLLAFAAAVQPRDPLLDMDEWDWRHALDVNLTSAFLMLQSVGRVMRAQGGGAILVLVDQPAEGDPHSAAYRTASAALRALAAAYREEAGAYNIAVHTIEAAALPAALDQALQGVPHAQE